MKDFFFQLSTYEIVTLSILTFFVIIQLFFYLNFYLRVALPRKPKVTTDKKNQPPVSIVICARDEELNLKSFLPSVLEQDYPDFEVIVVNDCSTDDTDMLLDVFTRKYPNLRYTTIKQDDKFTHGKKLALTVGIKAAKNSWLLLTDADCKPVSNRWLASMASNFDDSTELVLGYGGYFPERGLLNKLIRFDAFFIAMQYMGFALAGSPYMGVGRNLAYRKELFFRNRGFASHSHIFSGDDDLFVHQVANKRNTKVEVSHQAHTLSNPKQTYKAWFSQKKRHLTTGVLYKKRIKFLLSLEPLSRIFFWSVAIFSLTFPNLTWIALGAILFRLVLNGIIIKIVLNRLNEKKIFIISLVYDLLSPFMQIAIHSAIRLTPKRSKWN
ncbi:MAG TPA: glycosyltransferase [Tenuifilaceae bacterium]|nr:glycosyltransferase [Tenuifilaceae bacterium]